MESDPIYHSDLRPQPLQFLNAYINAYNCPMEFTCNPVKNDTNVRERGLPLLAARVMFNAVMLVREDNRRAYPERRFIG